MPVSRIAIGSPGELSHPDTFRAGVAEFISMLIFVFAGSGSGMAFGTYATSPHIDDLVFRLCIIMPSIVHTSTDHHARILLQPSYLTAARPRRRG
jgi:hypothetical protein